MKAAVAYEVGRPLVVEDLELPVVGPRDVLVRLTASGICHTDLTVIDGLSALPLPMVPGHEGCGIVEEVGAEVRRVTRRGPGARLRLTGVRHVLVVRQRDVEPLRAEVGRVVPTALRAAGRTAGAGAVWLRHLRRGDGGARGLRGRRRDRSRRRATRAPGMRRHDGLGAALITAGVTAGSSVAVVGCGAVGQSVVQGARIAGAATIIAIDPTPSRRDASLKVGATHAVDPSEGDVVGQVRALTSGRGADYSFEAVGRPELMVQAFDMARTAGVVTLVGMPPKDAELTLPAVGAIFSGKRLAGSVVGGAQILRDFPRFVRLAESGRLDLGSLVSERIGLDDINDGIDMLRRVEGVRTVIV